MSLDVISCATFLTWPLNCQLVIKQQKLIEITRETCATKTWVWVTAATRATAVTSREQKLTSRREQTLGNTLTEHKISPISCASKMVSRIYTHNAVIYKKNIVNWLVNIRLKRCIKINVTENMSSLLPFFIKCLDSMHIHYRVEQKSCFPDTNFFFD